MENVILIVHLILALSLIGIVLLQRSEGGGLGLGGGGGGGGVMSGRAAATALGKLTWIFAIGFIITSMTLTILAAARTDGGSVVDRVADVPPAPVEAPAETSPLGDDLLPPPAAGNEPLVPQAAE